MSKTLVWLHIFAILFLCNDGYDVNVRLRSQVSVGKLILISLSKGCPRRSWNFWPIRAKRFPRRPRTHRRAWSTRCKGNTEELGIPVLIYCIITMILSISTFSLPVIVFDLPMKGSHWHPWSPGSRGQARTTGRSCLTSC